MTQSYLKIMSGEDRPDGHHNKEFTILPLAEGISVQFKQDPMPVAILSNGCEIPVTGNAYITNQNGKSVATFAPNKNYVAEVTQQELPTEVYAKQLKQAKIIADSKFELVVEHEVDGPYRYELVGPWKHIFSDGKLFYANGKDGTVGLGDNLRVCTESVNTTLYARDFSGHIPQDRLIKHMTAHFKKEEDVHRILTAKHYPCEFIIKELNGVTATPLIQGDQDEVSLSDGRRGTIEHAGRIPLIPNTTIHYREEKYVILNVGPTLSTIRVPNGIVGKLNKYCLFNGGGIWLLDKETGIVNSVGTEVLIEHNGKIEHLWKVLNRDGKPEFSLDVTLVDKLKGEHEDFGVLYNTEEFEGTLRLADLVDFDKSNEHGLDMASGKFLLDGNEYHRTGCDTIPEVKNSVWAYKARIFIQFWNHNSNGGKGALELYTNVE